MSFFTLKIGNVSKCLAREIDTESQLARLGTSQRPELSAKLGVFQMNVYLISEELASGRSAVR